MTSNAVYYDRGSPHIAVENESEYVEDRELERVVRALQKQVDRHFFPLWGWRANLLFNRRPPHKRAMKIVVKDKPPREETGEVGYQFIEGLPITYVYTRDDDDEAVDFHATLSHEVLEMIADPGANLYACGYYLSPTGRHMNAWIPYEVCDPVQENLYEIDGVRVSDFVVPEWFEPERKRRSMRFSYLDSVREPFEIAKDGYIDAMVGRRIRTIWGEQAYRKKRRHRFRIRSEHYSRLCDVD